MFEDMLTAKVERIKEEVYALKQDHSEGLPGEGGSACLSPRREGAIPCRANTMEAGGLRKGPG